MDAIGVQEIIVSSPQEQAGIHKLLQRRVQNNRSSQIPSRSQIKHKG